MFTLVAQISVNREIDPFSTTRAARPTNFHPQPGPGAAEEPTQSVPARREMLSYDVDDSLSDAFATATTGARSRGVLDQEDGQPGPSANWFVSRPCTPGVGLLPGRSELA